MDIGAQLLQGRVKLDSEKAYRTRYHWKSSRIILPSCVQPLAKYLAVLSFERFASQMEREIRQSENEPVSHG